MHAARTRRPTPPPHSATRSAAAREALRLLGAFALYLVLYAVGAEGAFHRAYQAMVLGAGTLMLPWVQHFPVVSTLGNLELKNLDFVMLLLICLFVVSTRMPLRERAIRFAAFGSVVFAGGVAAVLLQSQTLAAQQLQRDAGVLLYLPSEFHVLDWFKYLLYDFGMEAFTFLLVAATVAWNSPELVSFASPVAAGPRQRSRPLAWAAVTSAAVVLVALLVWARIREHDPRHIATHARLGDLFAEGGKTAQAEAQYRAAISGGSKEAGPWIGLAALLRKRGASGEADRILRDGLDAVAAPEERRRIEDATRSASPTKDARDTR